MSLLEVLRFPDPRLRKKCTPVEEVTPELQQFAKDMLETMYSEHGIGLAAAQVNRQVRLLVMDTRPRSDNDEGEDRYDLSSMTEMEQQVEQPFIIFNPVIVDKKGRTTYEEGCLSLPSYFETVERFEFIEVEGLNIKGEKYATKVDGLMSICIQHEIDHLDGKLFIDHLSTIKSNRIKSKIKKFGYPSDEKDSQEGTVRA